MWLKSKLYNAIGEEGSSEGRSIRGGTGAGQVSRGETEGLGGDASNHPDQAGGQVSQNRESALLVNILSILLTYSNLFINVKIAFNSHYMT